MPHKYGNGPRISIPYFSQLANRGMWAVFFCFLRPQLDMCTYGMHLPWVLHHRRLTWRLANWVTDYMDTWLPDHLPGCPITWLSESRTGVVLLRQPRNPAWNPIQTPTLIAVQRQKSIIKIVEHAQSDGTISNDMAWSPRNRCLLLGIGMSHSCQETRVLNAPQKLT